MNGKISIVSVGPGDLEWIPTPAMDALRSANLLVGYETYMDQIASLFPEKPRVITKMRQEVQRATDAVDAAAQGCHVAVISGGDAGIYGMAGLVLEVLEQKGLTDQIDAEIIPGISALNAAAAALGCDADELLTATGQELRIHPAEPSAA